MDLDDKGVHEARGKWMRYVQGRSRRVGSAYWGSLPSVAADPSILLTTLKRWVRLAVKMILRAAVIPRSPWIRGSRKPGDPVAEIERENDFLEKNRRPLRLSRGVGCARNFKFPRASNYRSLDAGETPIAALIRLVVSCHRHDL